MGAGRGLGRLKLAREVVEEVVVRWLRTTNLGAKGFDPPGDL